jgi:hypothetical protein
MSIFNRVRQQAQQDAMNKAVPDEPPPAADAGMENMPTVKTGAPSFAPPADTSGWDVDSFGVPQYVAPRSGDAPSGWDPTKWADEKHQTPKYVWAGIYNQAKASGDPNWKQQAVEHLIQAYPGMKYGGKDVVYTPWGEEVDLFTDYGDSPLSKNGISWGVNSGPGGGGQKGLADLIGQKVGASLGASTGGPLGGQSNLKEILDQIQATANAPSDQQQPAQNDLVAQAQAVRDQARRDAVTRGFARGA